MALVHRIQIDQPSLAHRPREDRGRVIRVLGQRRPALVLDLFAEDRQAGRLRPAQRVAQAVQREPRQFAGVVLRDAWRTVRHPEFPLLGQVAARGRRLSHAGLPSGRQTAA